MTGHVAGVTDAPGEKICRPLQGLIPLFISWFLGLTPQAIHLSRLRRSGIAETLPGDEPRSGEINLAWGVSPRDERWKKKEKPRSGNKKRDKKMHGKVLLTTDHPKIVLRARRLEGELAPQGASDVTLHGEIEILGQSHRIGIPSHIEIDGGHFTATFEFEIPYFDWGLEDPSTFVLRVAKVVQVTVEAAGTMVIIG